MNKRLTALISSPRRADRHILLIFHQPFFENSPVIRPCGYLHINLDAVLDI